MIKIGERRKRPAVYDFVAVGREYKISQVLAVVGDSGGLIDEL